MNSTILAVSLLLLLASSAVCQNEIDFSGIFVPLPGNTSTDLANLEALGNRETLVGSIGLKESKYLFFGVRRFKARWPHVILTLTVLNMHGDADLYCSPWTWNAWPQPTQNAWRSIHSQKEDMVFMSAQTMHYQNSMIQLPTGLGPNGTETIASFACAVYGESSSDSVYELEVDLSFFNHTLVDEEQAAMQSIFDKCCAEEGSCHTWYKLTGRDTEKTDLGDGFEIEMDFCHRLGNVCNSEGRLTVLNLSNYNLTCEAPVEDFQKLEMLEKLDLNWNRLIGDVGGFLAGLSTLKNLHHVSAPANYLTGSLDSSEDACTLFDGQLSLLNLIGNNITGTIPDCALSSINLLELHVGWNKISGELPNSIPVGAKLEALTLEHNRVVGQLPASLGNARALRFLNLGDNLLNGPIIDEIAELPLLERLELDLNSFSEMPAAWVDPSATPPATLTRVDVSSNDIQGSFPAALGKAPILSRFDISNNLMSGEIMIDSGLFQNTSMFNISYNQFTGGLPDAIGAMKVFTQTDLSLTFALVFDVSSNQLTGEVPELFYVSNAPGIGFGNIRLDNNRFTCKEPSKLQYLKGLICNKESQIQEASVGGKKRELAVVAIVVICVSLSLALLIFAFIMNKRRRKSKQMVLVNDLSVEIGEHKAEDDTAILPTNAPRS